jgi:CHRD domain
MLCSSNADGHSMSFAGRRLPVRIRLIAVSLALLALLYGATAGLAQGGRPFATDLSGAEEAPGPGDPDGTGFASLTFNPGLGEVCFEITVENITLPAIAAHIHFAPAGVPGDIVVPLVPPDATGVSNTCVAADRALVLAIIKNPSEYYVNVHTSDFQAGAVRGQLGD